MMRGKKNNNLIVIENGQLNTYLLDDRLKWEIGRPSPDSNPDIKLYSATVSRRHGKLQNMDGIWFYMDYNGKNGTVYNDKHIEKGINGRTKPNMLSDGDVLIFGGGEQTSINHKTIWAMFSTRYFDEPWRVIDTKGITKITFTDGDKEYLYDKPSKGTVFSRENGIAIYMGDITYIAGDIGYIGN